MSSGVSGKYSQSKCGIERVGMDDYGRQPSHFHRHISYVDLVKKAKKMTVDQLDDLLKYTEDCVQMFRDLVAALPIGSQRHYYGPSSHMCEVAQKNFDAAKKAGLAEDQRIIDFIKIHLQQRGAPSKCCVIL